MRVLLVTNDRIGRQRAGPAIRCLELAKVMSCEHEVTVASAVPGDDVELRGKLILNALADQAELRSASRKADIAVVQGLALHLFPFLWRLCGHIVVDLYDPYLFEDLAQSERRFASWRYLRQWHLLNDQLRRGDFFMCANERQWDYWLGRLCALGRLTPEEHKRDPNFRRLLDVVPFGIPPEAPRHEKSVIKGVVPGITKDDTVLVWAGGIWQWFDPLTVIMAMSRLGRNDIKLIFLGTRHPNPDIKEMPIVGQAQKLTQELGLLGRKVFFRDGWIPFEERQSFLLEADIGVSAHTDTVETRLAFRTRILDYIWAGLPTIVTGGDYFADLLTRENVGRAIAPADVEGWKNAILSLVADEQQRREMRLRLQGLRSQFSWAKVAEPLMRYCRDPYHTRGLSGFRVRLARLLTPGYRRVLHLRRRRPESAISSVGDSLRPEFMDNGRQPKQ